MQMTPEQAYNLIGSLYEQQKQLSPRDVRNLDAAFLIIEKALGIKSNEPSLQSKGVEFKEEK